MICNLPRENEEEDQHRYHVYALNILSYNQVRVSLALRLLNQHVNPFLNYNRTR